VTEGPKHPGRQDWMACRTCKRVLSRHDEVWRNPETGEDREIRTTWVHTAVDLERGVNHPADPVPYDEMERVRLVCDFCSEPDPIWVLPVGDFTMITAPVPGQSNDEHSTSDWTACAGCGDLINRGDWRGLTRRAAQHASATSGAPVAEHEASLSKLYRLVRKNQKGGIRLIEQPLAVIESVTDSAHRYEEGRP